MGKAAQAICPVLAAKKKKNRPSPRKASPTRASSQRRRELPRPESRTSAPSTAISFEDHVLHAPPAPQVETPAALVPLLIGEDNQAVIKIVQKGRTPALRHLHRTHRINLDWITEVCAAEQVELKYVTTKEQVADMMTKHFDEKKSGLWNALLELALILPTEVPPKETPRTPNPKYPRRDRQPPPARPPPLDGCQQPCQVVCTGEEHWREAGEECGRTCVGEKP